MVGFRAIRPRTPIAPLARNPIPKIEQRMQQFGGDVVREMARYPAQMPTTYRRTGTLGRNWRMTYRRTSGRLVVEINNRVPYARYVQGPDDMQAREMRRRNWQRIDTVAQRNWDKARADIARMFRDSTRP